VFEISNFVKRTDASNNEFYIILANQMRAGYSARLRWTVSGAGTLTLIASCEYRDMAGNVQTGSGYVCGFSGALANANSSQNVRPIKPGTVRYTLTATNEGGTVSKTITAGIKEFQMFEIHPSLPLTLVPGSVNAASLFTILREHLQVLNTVP
jgi:hypothetical protein